MSAPTRPRGLPHAQKKTAAEPASTAVVETRRKGALLGLACGEALGVTLTQKRAWAPAFPQLADGPHTAIIGQGPFNMPRGQVLDATPMAIALSDSLLHLTHYDAIDAARGYFAWKQESQHLGEQTRRALDIYEMTKNPEFCGQRVWTETGKRAAGCAALTRAVPIAVYFSENQDARVAASFSDAAITHFAPECQLANAVFNELVAKAIHAPAEGLAPSELAGAVEKLLVLAAAEMIKRHTELIPHIEQAHKTLLEDLSLAQKEDPELYGPELHLFTHAGALRVAFRLLLWELCHAPTLEIAVIDAVNRGGSAHSHGALVGAMFGAIRGETAVPEPWRTAVMDAPLMPEASLGWARRFHPKQLMKLTDALHPAALGHTTRMVSPH